jgi:hypothetical protein
MTEEICDHEVEFIGNTFASSWYLCQKCDRVLSAVQLACDRMDLKKQRLEE